MNGFRSLSRRQLRELGIHARDRDLLRAMLILRARGSARALIAAQTLAALRPGGANTPRFQSRFLRAQASGMDLERHATTRIAFLLRQLQRMERKLDASA